MGSCKIYDSKFWPEFNESSSDIILMKHNGFYSALYLVKVSHAWAHLAEKHPQKNTYLVEFICHAAVFDVVVGFVLIYFTDL